MSKDTIPWDWLKERSASVFLLAGLLQLIHVGYNLVLGTAVLPASPDVVGDLMLASAQITAYIALLGLVPLVHDDHPRLARVGGVLAGMAILGMFLIAIGEPIIEFFIGQRDQPPLWFMPVQFLYLIGAPLSFLVFGIASVRSEIPSRSVGGALLFLFVWYLVFLHVIPIDAFIEGFSPRITELAMALGFLASGFLLRVRSSSPGQPETTSETAAR